MATAGTTAMMMVKAFAPTRPYWWYTDSVGFCLQGLQKQVWFCMDPQPSLSRCIGEEGHRTKLYSVV